jgi:protein AFG1
MATTGRCAVTAEGEKKGYIAPVDGPMKEYDTRVEEGRLRDDPYQRGKLLYYS